MTRSWMKVICLRVKPDLQQQAFQDGTENSGQLPEEVSVNSAQWLKNFCYVLEVSQRQ
jgi:hypothetical protein